MSKSVTYVGGYADVNVQLEVGAYVFVERGSTIELPDEIADGLVERGDFVLASAASESGAPAQAATKDAWHAYRAAQGWPEDVLEPLTKAELVELADTPQEA